jgi:hypothetical protein
VGTREELRRQSGNAGALEQTFLALTAEEADLAAAGKRLGSMGREADRDGSIAVEGRD